MKQGEIWLINYPDGAGHEYFKERPALIIESNKQIIKTNIYTVVAITSNTNNITDDDILIARNNFKLFIEVGFKVLKVLKCL